jgi:hypothetical protein
MKYLTLVAACCLLSALCLAQAPQKFYYQAVARDVNGAPMANANVSFQLTIVQTSPAGTDVYQEIHPVVTSDHGVAGMEVGTGLVVSGDFLTINWGADSYFLRTEFDPNGGFVFQLMGTSELISVPYALHAASADNVDDADADPLNEIQTLSLVGADLTILGGNTVTLPSGTGGNTLDAAYDQGGAGAGRIIEVDAGAVELNVSQLNGIGLDATANSTGSVAIAGEVTQPANAFSAIQGITNSNSSAASAVLGNSDAGAWGVTGQATVGSTTESAVYGSNFRTTGGHGILGIGFNGGVGMTDYRAGFGLYGENFDAIGSTANIAAGVAGLGYYGVIGEDRYLGGVFGAFGVFANGDMGSSGIKSFQIDHPNDPYNQYIRHFCLESNEVLNIYRGNVVLNESGEATVALPDYFESINRDYSYQLTPVGGYAALYIKEEVSDGSFVIAGGSEGLKVSWTVQAERNDPYLQTYPEKRADVVLKNDREKGKLQIPALYGGSEEDKMFQSPAKIQQEELKLHGKK